MVVDVFTADVLEQADLITSGLLLLLEGEESSSLRRDSREGGNRPEFSECHRNFFVSPSSLTPTSLCSDGRPLLVLGVLEARLGSSVIPTKCFLEQSFL